MKHARTAAIAASVGGMFTAAALADVTLYEVVDLGMPDPHDCSCNARAVNITGAVAGFFFGADSDYNGFVATGEAMIDFSPAGENRTQGLGINDAGLVVGWTNHFPLQAAILYDGQNVIDLGTLGGRFGTAHHTAG